MIQQMLAIWSLIPLAFLNLAWTSGSSWFMYCWSLAWRILSITLLVCEMSAILQYFEQSLALPFFGIRMKTNLFQSCGHCWVFHICWHMECSTFTASSFRIWSSPTGIPSPLLALLVVSCCCLVAKLCLTLCDPMDCSKPDSPVHPGVCSDSCALNRMMPSNHLILCYPLLPPSIFSSIRVFSSELALQIRWPKYWHFSFSISPSNEYSGLISLRIDWFDLLAVQGTLKSLLQHHSSRASVLRLLAFMDWVIS